MVISRRSRCGLHAVGYLAHRQKETDAPIALPEIREYLRSYSRKATFSAGHVSKILQELCRAGVLRALPGRNGGYNLARPSEDIRLVEIVRALDGSNEEQCCLLSIGPCDNRGNCGVFRVIQDAERSFYGFLEGETAASLAKKMFGAFPPPNLRRLPAAPKSPRR